MAAQQEIDNYWEEAKKRRKSGVDAELDRLRRALGESEAKRRFEHEQVGYHKNVNADFRDTVRGYGRYIAVGVKPVVVGMVTDIEAFYMNPRRARKAVGKRGFSWPFGAWTSVFMGTFAAGFLIIALTPAYALGFGNWINQSSGFIPNGILLLIIFVLGLLVATRIDKRRGPT